jgi:phosphoglycolate phosphatase-like HAD superfamily hydrolase
MKLVMFDIDGTLTQTDQADQTCFVQALREIFGFSDVNTDWASYPHCSDSGILEVLFQSRAGRSPLPAEVSAFQVHFLSLLASATAVQPFSPIPGAQDFLCRLIEDPAFAVSLATGAWEASARFKLASAGLALQQIPAAFSDDAHTREAIMQASLARAARSHSRDAFDVVIYVGDGVWDARASRNLGFSFIGISHEPAKVERLYTEGAGHVFHDYVDADSFYDCLTRIQPCRLTPMKGVKE